MMPELQHQVILGMDWLKKVNPVIDWADCTVTVSLSDGSKVECTASTVGESIKVELCSVQ